MKDDLVKRLDEAVCAENQTHDNGVNDINHPEGPPSDDADSESYNNMDRAVRDAYESQVRSLYSTISTTN